MSEHGATARLMPISGACGGVPPRSAPRGPLHNEPLATARRRLAEGLRTCLPDQVSTASLPRRSTIYAAGQRSGSVYLLEAGWVKAQTQSEHGKSCLIGLYGADDVIGSSGLFRGERIETATTLAPTVLKVLPGWLFLRALERANLREAWLLYQAERTFEYQSAITLFVTADSEYRLAATLLRMAYRFGVRHGDRYHIGYRLTQEELSEMVGTTRSRVGYFLKRFQKLGLIRVLRASGIVIDEPRLRDYMSTTFQAP